MRKFTVFSLILFIVIIGCSNDSDNEPKPIIPEEIPPVLNNETTAVIYLPKASATRAIGLEKTIQYTNYFHAFFRKTDSDPVVYYSASATLAEEKIEVGIPAGSYDILLLAGNKQENLNSIILASSYVLDKEIIKGKVNNINMELVTFDVDIICPDYVTIGESFTVDVNINTKNPLIQLSSYVILNNSGHTYLFPNKSEGNLWTCNTTITAPLTPQVITLSLMTGLYVPFGLTNQQFSTWCWAQAGWVGLDPSFYTKTVNITNSLVLPEVKMSITWATE